VFLSAEEQEKAKAKERALQSALREIWRDRLSADALRNPVIADLVAHCQRCGDTLAVEIGGDAARWVVRHSRIARDERGVWRHTGCGGALRFYGRLPEPRPERISGDRGPW
jgi:hypothetical protein